uniref:Uncharacterized protein n=1 Tax=Nelumbo nucifera TaxID=4432 RepID=A0A822Y5R9_NELNU|nr:TPA_asm: hypothetical protein HUJ06_029338 [Nelumbo nucifera]
MLQASATTIQSVMCVAKQVTWLVSALVQAYLLMTQDSATIATSQAILLLTAPMRRPATTVARLATWPVNALMNLSAISAMCRVMLPVSVSSLA